MEGWVDQVDLIAPRPGVEPASSDLSITSPTPNRCTTKTTGETLDVFRLSRSLFRLKNLDQSLYPVLKNKLPVVDVITCVLRDHNDTSRL